MRGILEVMCMYLAVLALVGLTYSITILTFHPLIKQIQTELNEIRGQ